MKDNLEFIVKYWSQLILLLGLFFGGVGFLLKLYFNWNIKRKEITFNKITETKITELKQFYSSFKILETHLKKLQVATAQGNIEFENKVREKLPEIWDKFYHDFTFLRLFLNSEELELFEKLNKVLDDIQLKLDFQRIDRDLGETDSDLVKELRLIRSEVFPKQIPKLLDLIETNLKKEFGVKKISYWKKYLCTTLRIIKLKDRE